MPNPGSGHNRSSRAGVDDRRVPRTKKNAPLRTASGERRKRAQWPAHGTIRNLSRALRRHPRPAPDSHLPAVTAEHVDHCRHSRVRPRVDRLEFDAQRFPSGE